MGSAIRLIFVTFSLAAAGQIAMPALSQAPSMAGRWQSDWGDRRCTLARHPVGDQPMLVIRATPGTRIWELTLAGRNWPRALRLERPNVVARLLPSRIVLDGAILSAWTPDNAGIRIGELSHDLLQRLAESQSLAIEVDRRVIGEIPLRSVREAIAVMRQCETTALREWGIDPEAFAAVTPPIANFAQFFYSEDYPAEARRAGQSGQSIVRLTIEPDGRVSECAPVAGSRIGILDEAACRILLNRGRATTPARDARGIFVRSQMIVSIVWRA